MSQPQDTELAPALLKVEGLTKHFPVVRGVFGKVVGQVRAVDDVSFELAAGETLSLVGESGCGKTTTGRSILRLIEPSRGRVHFEGRDITQLSQAELREFRRDMQIIFQDPFSSLNPRMRVLDIVGEAIEAHGIATGAAVEQRVLELLERVGIARGWVHRYPHEFSGGQRQRIGIARALALGPKLIVCDEAVSALDVSIRAQVVNLLIDLQKEFRLSYLFIAHDLSVVRHISHQVGVMYLGQLVELSSKTELFARPLHPYTRSLLSAVPVANPRAERSRIILHGDVPSPLNPPSGCRFHTRCPAVFERCPVEEPPLYQLRVGALPSVVHSVKCFHAAGLEDITDANELAQRVLERSAAAEAANRQAVSTLAKVPLAEPLAPPTEPAADDDSPAALRARAKFAVAWMLLLTLGLLSVGYAQNHKLRRAGQELEELRSAVSAFAAAHGKNPNDLSALGWRLPLILGQAAPLDPWGRPWQFQATETSFKLSSLGPDGKPSSDDIGDR